MAKLHSKNFLNVYRLEKTVYIDIAENKKQILEITYVFKKHTSKNTGKILRKITIYYIDPYTGKNTNHSYGYKVYSIIRNNADICIQKYKNNLLNKNFTQII